MQKTVLIIGFVWPEPNSSAAGSRMLQLIRTFLVYNYSITFATACAKNKNAFDLSSIDVNSVEIELNDSSFDKFLVKLNPDVVVFDRFMIEEQFGWRVAEQCPEALRILDTEDLHCLRRGRQQAFKDNIQFNESYLFNETAKREIASVYRSDLSLIISEAEMDILINKFKVDKSLLLYLPFMLDQLSTKQQADVLSFEERAHFITIGNFQHDPNYDAILFLKQSIWPLIRRRLPKVEMQVYGAYRSQKVNQLHNEKEGFLIKGFVQEVNEAMQKAKVCLAPLRFGAGLKGKLFDAMQNGTPSVTTKIGAEGIFGNFDVNGFIEDDIIEFAEKAVTLYTNQDLWKDKQKKGFDVINRRYRRKKFQDDFLKTIESLNKNLKKHRLKNFTGSMLQHHMMQSTKYMSKWIEEKNSNTTQ